MLKMRILEYLRKLMESKSLESSKRFISFYTMILVTIVTITGIIMSDDYVTILITLLTFIGSLLGIATLETISKHKNDSNSNTKP